MRLATVTLQPLSSPHQQTYSLFWFGIIHIIWLFCHFILMSVLSLLLVFLFDAYNGFTVIAFFILLYMFFVCVCLVNCPCLCALLFVWSFGNLGPACVLGRCPSHQSIWLPQLNEWRKKKKQRRLKTRKRLQGRWERKRKNKMLRDQK